MDWENKGLQSKGEKHEQSNISRNGGRDLEADLAAESNSWNRWDQTERLLWITPFMMQWKPDLIRLYL